MLKSYNKSQKQTIVVLVRVAVQVFLFCGIQPKILTHCNVLLLVSVGSRSGIPSWRQGVLLQVKLNFFGERPVAVCLLLAVTREVY
jgi:hypothetical protein